MPTTPNTRTRSGSSAQNITYQDMKTLLDTLKNDLKLEINKLNDKIEALFKRADESDARTRALEERCHLLESQLALSPLTSGPGAEEVIREAEERHKRRKYIIVSGVAEHESGSVEERKKIDTEIMEEIVEELGIKDFAPEEVSRLGSIRSSRPRLLRVKCESVDVRNHVLKKARKLRDSDMFKNVYVNADQTFLQRQMNRELRGGKIVLKSTIQNFL